MGKQLKKQRKQNQIKLYRFYRKKRCIHCIRNSQIGYRDVSLLKEYLKNESLVKRYSNGNCNKHQSQITNAVKVARYLGLLAYAPIHKIN